jgi:hypothetical protein
MQRSTELSVDEFGKRDNKGTIRESELDEYVLYDRNQSTGSCSHSNNTCRLRPGGRLREQTTLRWSVRVRASVRDAGLRTRRHSERMGMIKIVEFKLVVVEYRIQVNLLYRGDCRSMVLGLAQRFSRR